MKYTKKTVLGISIFLSMANLFHSQTISGGSNQLDFIRESLRINNQSTDKSDADGSPYIFDNFSPVIIKGFEKKIFTGRYNAFNGQMEINIGDETIALNEKNTYEVVFTEKKITYRTFKYKNRIDKLQNGFLVVVNEKGNTALLKEERIKYYEKIKAKTSYDTDKSARFKKESDRYYFKNGDKITYIPTKNKNLYKLFPAKTKQIKKFIKENSISLNDEKDLIKLVNILAEF